MTDTGQIPGEGQPENAGGQPDGQHQDFLVNGSYSYAGQAGHGLGDAAAPGAAPADPDVLLPGSQGAWGDPQQTGAAGAPSPAQMQAQIQAEMHAQMQAAGEVPQMPGQPEFAGHQDLYGQHVPYDQQEFYGQQVAYVPSAEHAQHVPHAQQHVAQAEQLQYGEQVQYGEQAQYGEQLQYGGQEPQEAVPPAYGPVPDPAQDGAQDPAQHSVPDPAQGGAQPAPDAPYFDAADADAQTPGPHETDGRDSGAIDCAPVRESFPEGQTPAQGTPRPKNPRRPLHLGPPEPEQSGAVRPLSDRGLGRPANGKRRKGARGGQGQRAQQAQQTPQSQPSEAVPEARQNGQVRPEPQLPEQQAQPQPEPETEQQSPSEQQAEVPVQHGESVPAQDAAAGGVPEYMDVPQDYPADLPGPQLGALPPQNETWTANGQAHGETEASASAVELPVQHQESQDGLAGQEAYETQEADESLHVQEQVMAFAGPQPTAEAGEFAVQAVPGAEHAPAVMPSAPDGAVQQPEHLPSAVAGAGTEPGAHAASADVPSAPEHGAATAPVAAPGEQTAAPRTGGRKRRHRRAKETESETTGNTWVSSPGSTAVEAIEPQQDGVDAESAEAGGAVPAVDGTMIPAQQQPQAAAEPAPADEAAQAVPGIPAQQTRHPEQPETPAAQGPQLQDASAPAPVPVPVPADGPQPEQPEQAEHPEQAEQLGGPGQPGQSEAGQPAPADGAPEGVPPEEGAAA
ncbi:hypothetical protein AN218_30085, partial [Streptomyces nanshensis]